MARADKDVAERTGTTTRTQWHSYVMALEASAVPIVIADPHAPDMPLVFVNSAFLALTGYAEHEVLGRNCRFLQGPETAEADRLVIERGLADRAAISLEILNYKKDGSPFWNELHMAPMYDEAGEPGILRRLPGRYHWAKNAPAGTATGAGSAHGSLAPSG
ncbi:PAS domain-containing protein [Devosia algicola]|uniref:PAS domain-containing protein n=1 Tax=Devosia algicola TaxID=3026418 RepID=A0ABY7YKX4_9HYPH|nr:PAS domain-containing protein [Devosia algicola]WDR01842.1 PAS domain-containing protein [Devosia algicola]